VLALSLFLSGCATEPTAESNFRERFDRHYGYHYGYHRDMQTEGGHDVVWNSRSAQKAFDKAREEGIDMTVQQQYAYTFTGSSSESLRTLAEQLEQDGYKRARFELVPDPAGWELEMRKTEKHTPQSLSEANVRLSRLAESRHAFYEGWRVQK